MVDVKKAEAVKAEVGHEGGSHSSFPPFETQNFPSQLLWLAISFGALYLFMSRSALPKIGALIDERKARIAKDLDDATKAQLNADAASAAHLKTLADARAKAQAVAQEARDRVSADTDAKRKAIESQLNAKLAAAEQQIGATRTQAMTNVGAIAESAAGAIVERLLGKAADATAISHAVAAAVQTAKTA